MSVVLILFSKLDLSLAASFSLLVNIFPRTVLPKVKGDGMGQIYKE
jgi:hypothetical protein